MYLIKKLCIEMYFIFSHCAQSVHATQVM